MPQSLVRLLNATEVDAVPASLLPARRNAHARQLAKASWLLRRKSDGRYLATLDTRDQQLSLQPFGDQAAAMPTAIDELLGMLGLQRQTAIRRHCRVPLQHLPTRQQALPQASALLQPLLRMLAVLGVDPWQYRDTTGLPLLLEPRLLAPAGRDRYRRPLWLTDDAATAWLRMRAAATDDGIDLEAISGFRSYAYQHGIFRRKLARGQRIEQILAVNAAPGFSEHHSGRALDIGTPGEPPAEETFERTAAFGWLSARAGEFGFRMSYPRGNPHGIVYEPWHWCYVGLAG